jgi:hypothetical protein
LRQLSENLALELEPFGDDLDHQVRLAYRLAEVLGVSDPPECLACGSTGRGVDLPLVLASEFLEVRPGCEEQLVADVVGADLNAGVGDLIDDLRAQDAGAEHRDVLDVRVMVLSGWLS